MSTRNVWRRYRRSQLERLENCIYQSFKAISMWQTSSGFPMAVTVGLSSSEKGKHGYRQGNQVLQYTKFQGRTYQNRAFSILLSRRPADIAVGSLIPSSSTGASVERDSASYALTFAAMSIAF